MLIMADVLVLYDGAMLLVSLNGGGRVLGASEPAIDGSLEEYAGRPRRVDSVDVAPRLCRCAIPNERYMRNETFACQVFY